MSKSSERICRYEIELDTLAVPRSYADPVEFQGVSGDIMSGYMLGVAAWISLFPQLRERLSYLLS